jgi:hypothetical protein
MKITAKQAKELGIVAKPKNLKRSTVKSSGGVLFKAACEAHGLPEPIAEYKFCEGRKWRADWCFKSLGVLVEIDGGSFIGGRHTRGAGFEEDIKKHAEAICLGWSVLRVTPIMVKNGRLFEWLKRIKNGMGSERQKML